jgi:hypothetical protein
VTRAERKAAAREVLAKLWQLGWEYDTVAAEMGVDRLTVSRWNCGALAPKHPQLWRLQELSEPELAADVMARIARVKALTAEWRRLDKVWRKTKDPEAELAVALYRETRLAPEIEDVAELLLSESKLTDTEVRALAAVGHTRRPAPRVG